MMVLYPLFPPFSYLEHAMISTTHGPFAAPQTSDTEVAVDTEPGFLYQLWSGNLGLARTYWVYLVVGGGLVELAMYGLWQAIFYYELLPYVDEVPVLFRGFVALAESMPVFVPWAYNLFVCVGLWRAAGKYQGPWIWKAWASLVALVQLVSGPIILVTQTWIIISALLG